MPRRLVRFAKGEYYHIYNRGVNHCQIFFTPQNYQYCLDLIEQNFSLHAISSIAYCLMPNHYHFLIRQDGEASLHLAFYHVFKSYTQAVNRQENRTGTLFEGRFKSILVDRQEYLLHLCRYIHLNPVMAGLVKKPEDWFYSNYSEWIGIRDNRLTEMEFVRDVAVFVNYRDFVKEYKPPIKAEKWSGYIVSE